MLLHPQTLRAQTAKGKAASEAGALLRRRYTALTSEAWKEGAQFHLRSYASERADAVVVVGTACA